jgi:hypothetical protein
VVFVCNDYDSLISCARWILSQTICPFILRIRPAPESSFETGGYLFVLQSSGRLECSEHLQIAFCSEDRGKFCGLWNRACEEYKRSLQDAKKPNAFATAPAAAPTNIFGKTQAFPAAPAAGGGGAAFPAPAPLMPNLLGGGGGFLTDVNQKKDHPASVLWPYYKLWFEHLMMKSIKHDVKDKSSSVLCDSKEISRREYRIDARMHRVPSDFAVCDAPQFFLFYLQPVGSFLLFSGGQFTNVLVVQEENQHTRSQKPEEAWPMFKYTIHTLFQSQPAVLFTYKFLSSAGSIGRAARKRPRNTNPWTESTLFCLRPRSNTLCSLRFQ